MPSGMMILLLAKMAREWTNNVYSECFSNGNSTLADVISDDGKDFAEDSILSDSMACDSDDNI